MNYARAVSTEVEQPTFHKKYDLPKGYIVLTKLGIYNTLTEEEIEQQENQEKTDCYEKIVYTLTERFILNKCLDLERDGFNEDEITAEIDYIFNQYDNELEDNYNDSDSSDYDSDF